MVRFCDTDKETKAPLPQRDVERKKKNIKAGEDGNDVTNHRSSE